MGIVFELYERDSWRMCQKGRAEKGWLDEIAFSKMLWWNKSW
jgi:hypothetical protein